MRCDYNSILQHCHVTATSYPSTNLKALYKLKEMRTLLSSTGPSSITPGGIGCRQMLGHRFSHVNPNLVPKLGATREPLSILASRQTHSSLFSHPLLCYGHLVSSLTALQPSMCLRMFLTLQQGVVLIS